MLNKIINFLKEVIAELKKVTWTPRKDLINSTYVVIITSVCLGLFITSVDLILTRGLQLLLK